MVVPTGKVSGWTTIYNLIPRYKQYMCKDFSLQNKTILSYRASEYYDQTVGTPGWLLLSPGTQVFSQIFSFLGLVI